MKITVTPNPNHGTLPASDKLGFGTVFTDHMFLMDYTDCDGWHNARIVPFGPISVSPAASVLHYGTEVFEGLKAYRRLDGEVVGMEESFSNGLRHPGDAASGRGSELYNLSLIHI